MDVRQFSTPYRKVLRRFQRLVPRTSEGVMILAYHLVGSTTRSIVDIPELVFRQQMEELHRTATPVSIRDAAELLEGGASNPSDRPFVAVTFDDAFSAFFEYAFPILEEFGIPVALYVPIAFVDGESPNPLISAEGAYPASWDQLRGLAQHSLATIGSHSVTHPNLLKAESERARYEIVESREILQEELGVAVESFCYPESFTNTEIRRLVRDNYRTAVCGGGLRAMPRRSPRECLPRVAIRRDMPGSVSGIISSRACLEELGVSFLRGVRGRYRRESASDQRMPFNPIPRR